MKSKGAFRALSIVLVSSISILLPGCEAIPAAQPQRAEQETAQNVKTAERTAATAPNGAPKTPDWATMTARQLGQYDKIHGGAPPFGGAEVARVPPAKAVAAIPDHFQIKPGHANFERRDFRILDAWKGKLRGHTFLFDVYSEKKTKNIVVGVRYANRPVLAYSLGTSHYILRNFTGSFAGFAVPGLNWRFYYAINLATGQVVTSNLTHPKHQHLVEELAGCYPCVGSTGAEWITGLSKKYPFSP